MSSRLKNDCSNPPGRSILLKFYQIVAKKRKQEVTKFGSHSLSGFRVAANTMVVWDKNPPRGNRVGVLELWGEIFGGGFRPLITSWMG